MPDQFRVGEWVWMDALPHTIVIGKIVAVKDIEDGTEYTVQQFSDPAMKGANL